MCIILFVSPQSMDRLCEQQIELILQAPVGLFEKGVLKCLLCCEPFWWLKLQQALQQINKEAPRVVHVVHDKILPRNHVTRHQNLLDTGQPCTKDLRLYAAQNLIMPPSNCKYAWQNLINAQCRASLSYIQTQKTNVEYNTDMNLTGQYEKKRYGNGKMNRPVAAVIFAQLECSPLTLLLQASSTPFHVWSISQGVDCKIKLSMHPCHHMESLQKHL